MLKHTILLGALVTGACALDADTTNSQPDCETQWNGGTYEAAPTDTVVHTKGMLGWVQFDVTQDVHAIRQVHGSLPNH